MLFLFLSSLLDRPLLCLGFVLLLLQRFSSPPHGPLFRLFIFVFSTRRRACDPVSEVPSSGGATADPVAEAAGPETGGGTAEDGRAAGNGSGFTRSGSREDGKVAREREGDGERDDSGGGKEGEAERGEQRGAHSAARPCFSPGLSP